MCISFLCTYIHIALVSSSLKLFSLRFCRFQGSPLERLNIVVVICARWLDDEKKVPFQSHFHIVYFLFIDIWISSDVFWETHNSAEAAAAVSEWWDLKCVKAEWGSLGCEVSVHCDYWQVASENVVFCHFAYTSVVYFIWCARGARDDKMNQTILRKATTFLHFQSHRDALSFLICTTREREIYKRTNKKSQ